MLARLVNTSMATHGRLSRSPNKICCHAPASCSSRLSSTARAAKSLSTKDCSASSMAPLLSVAGTTTSLSMFRCRCTTERRGDSDLDHTLPGTDKLCPQYFSSLEELAEDDSTEGSIFLPLFSCPFPARSPLPSPLPSPRPPPSPPLVVCFTWCRLRLLAIPRVINTIGHRLVVGVLLPSARFRLFFVAVSKAERFLALLTFLSSDRFTTSSPALVQVPLYMKIPACIRLLTFAVSW